MTQPPIADNFAFHRATPHISVDEHERRRVIELGERLMSCHRVYLDKCFWINLRAARARLPCPPGCTDLLDSLTTEVAGGRLICPISDALFLELMKQTDRTSRRATAQLIDELSLGVTLATQPTRVATEVAHFIHANLGRSVHPLEHLVWTKVPFVLGVQHAVATAFSKDEQLVIQKSFFDHQWDLPLSTIVETIADRWPADSPYADLASRLTRDNAAHADSMKSFARVYRDEINGVLELAAPIAADVLLAIAKKQLGLCSPSTEEWDDTVRQWLGLLRAAMRQPAGKRALRTLHIGALLHAGVRWNRGQKLVANDLFDFRHAEAALAYCDLLLTDGPMHTLLMQRHLSIERDFSCRVISSAAAAAEWVQGRQATT